jgi:hypothetical protein
LQYAEACDNCICCGDSRDDVACHLLDIKARFRLDPEYNGSDIGTRGYKVKGILVVLVEDYGWLYGIFVGSVFHLFHAFAKTS